MRPISTNNELSESAVDPKSRRRVGYRRKMPIKDVKQAKGKSCVLLRTEKVNLPINPADKKPLDQIDSEGDFFTLDYIFQLHIIVDGGHWILAGIAPKREFIFIIDTVRHDRRYEYLNILANLKSIVLHYLRAKGNDEPGWAHGDWPVYTMWSYRLPSLPDASKMTKPDNYTADRSPNTASQTDQWNCGVFALTNALNLAFGFDTNFIVSQIWIRSRYAYSIHEVQFPSEESQLQVF